jgi:hypothetical protein
MGIKGAHGMKKNELIDALEEVDPDYFAPMLDLISGPQLLNHDPNKGGRK